MAFFEELGKTLTDTGKEVATKAKALTETIQLRSQISTEKGKLEEAYAAIGKIYYDSVREPDEACAKAYEAVKSCRERIAALEIELTQAEGSKICAVCGAKVSKDSLYCGKCGSPIKEEAAEDETETRQAADESVASAEESAAAEEPENMDHPAEAAENVETAETHADDTAEAAAEETTGAADNAAEAAAEETTGAADNAAEAAAEETTGAADNAAETAENETEKNPAAAAKEEQ